MGRSTRKALGSVATLGLVLGAAEGLTRVVHAPSEPRNVSRLRMSAPAPFPGVPFVLPPDAVASQVYGSDPRGYFEPGGKITYRTNSLGFRGPETDVAKAPGTYRVVGLGDSFTFGVGVHAEDTFLARLEVLMNASGEVPVEVLNLGVFGYDTVNEVALLSRRGLELEPDLVILCFFVNDVGGEGTLRLFNRGSVGARSPWRSSRVLDVLAERIARRRAMAENVLEWRRHYAEGSAALRNAQVALQGALEMSRKHGFDLLLVIFPVLWKLSDYPFGEFHQVVSSFAREVGIECLDLTPAFAGHDGPELWVHPGDQHPNELAHAIAAEAIHRRLVASRLPE